MIHPTIRQKTRRLWPAALAVTGLALGLPAAAHATELMQAKVHYAKSNLTTESGARAVHAQLRRAANQACGPMDLRDLRQVAAVRECRQRAVDEAVAAINAPMLTAVHSGAPLRYAGAGETRTSR